jgi:5-methyltetrahydrofolate--homocysteine methyltransferase
VDKLNILNELSENLQSGNVPEVSELTQKALDEKIEPHEILEKGLIAGMTVVGARFKAHEIYLPSVLLAAKAMYAGMDLIKPLMLKEENPFLGKVVIGTVQGDLHDIGKNLVSIMLKGAGFDLIDLGKDVSPEKFVDAAIENEANIIGMSALLTTTMAVMKKVIELAKERGIYGKVKFLIGGAPLSDDFAKEIGANAYCFDGISAVETAKQIIQEK